MIKILILALSLNLFAEDIIATPVSVYDGDTFKVNIDEIPYKIFSKGISIRVRGIDTPEMHGKCDNERKMARKAKEIVKKYLSNKRVRLIDVKRGKYFRIVATVKSVGEKETLEEVLLRENVAVEYDGGKKTKDWCNEHRKSH